MSDPLTEHDMKLTVERLFESPPLYGSPPVDLRFAPDNNSVTFRAPAADDRERLELIAISLTDAQRSVLIDPRKISDTSSDVTALTDEERAERERRRDFSHGVTSYHWRPQYPQQLLLPMNGQAYLTDISIKPEAFQPLCPADTRQSSFQFSPDGQYLGYVRERDLYILNLADAQESRLTQTRSELESFGLADFLAAEEMHRFEGFWWQQDSRAILYTRVDDTEVAISHRLELDAQGARSVSQRYPFAGATNPTVELYHHNLDQDEPTCLWRSQQNDEYLARVTAMQSGLLIQVQDRRQQHLRYLWQAGNHPRPDGWQEIFVESSETWVNLTDDVRESPHGIIMTEELSGLRRVQLLPLDGPPRSLSGPTHINAVLACTEDHVYATGWDTTPVENHLYRLSYADGAYQQLTAEAGWHDVTLNESASAFIDRFSSAATMLQISVVDLGTDQTQILHREKVAAPHPYAPYLKNHAASEIGQIEADDGTPLYYKLTAPSPVRGMHPVIVYVYGGPGAQKVRNDWGALLVQLFAQQGFGVLELDNRGSTNRGRAFEAPLYRHMGTVEVADQVAGLSILEKTDWADTERVGVYGHSYGGYMTLMCLTQATDRFAAGVAVAPVCDWQLYDSHYTERYMGLPQENEAGYQQGNVLAHLAHLQAPLLLMHGMADDNVLFQNSTMIMNRLQELGKPFELMTYPGAKHSMQEQHVSVHRLNMILDFFRRHL